MLRGGFTILEILMALIVMTVVLIPLMQLMPQGMSATTKLERLAHCAFLAQAEIEDLRRAVFDSDYDFDGTDSSQGPTACVSPFENYKYTVSDDQAEDIKQINLTVWFDDNGNSVYDSDEPGVSLDSKIADRN